MRVLVINNAEVGQTEFSDPIEKGLKKKGISVDVLFWCAINDPSNFVREYDAVIGTGSSQGDDPMETRAPVYKEWLVKGEIPYFGICAGHHMQGYIREIPLIRDGSQSETGDLPVFVVKDDPIFNNICTAGNEIIVKQQHNDAIPVPKDFILLATSNECKCQMMKHAKYPFIYSTQFHPEYFNMQLLYNFCDLVQGKL